MDHIAEFADRLREAMDEKGMRQVDLLRACSLHSTDPGQRISQSLLSQYLNGGRIPRPARLYLIAAVLGVRPSWLLGFDVDREPDAGSAEAADPLADEEDDFYKEKMDHMKGRGWKFDYQPETGLFAVHHIVKGVQEITYMDADELKLKLDLLEDLDNYVMMRPFRRERIFTKL